MDWQVAREENVSHYEIERSPDATDWTRIGEVIAVGNTDRAVEYEFDDFAPGTNRNYYRLRMVDTDGSYEYSGIVIVEIANEGAPAAAVFPNPAPQNGRLGIQLTGDWLADQPIEGRLFDVAGRQVSHYPALDLGTSSVTLPATARAGVYVLRIVQADRVITRKIAVR